MPPRQPAPAPSLLTRRLTHLLTPLHPLLAITTGTPHPLFPTNLLSYHLLSEPALDSLASFYHQRTPSTHSDSYPAPLTPGRWQRMEALEREAGVGVAERVQGKRRRFGRFIGLRGCESPVGGEEEVRRWVEGEMERRARRAAEEEVWRGKVGGGRW